MSVALPRSAFVSALLQFALGSGAVLAAATRPVPEASLVPILLAGGAFTLFAIAGLDFAYLAPFAKRELASELAGTAVVVFLNAGAFATLVGWVLGNTPLLRMGAISFGTGGVGLVLLLAASLAFGPSWRSGRPMPATDTPYRAWDQSAAASALASLAGLALSSALLAFGRAPLGYATFLALLGAFGAPAVGAFLLHTLPRNLHRPGRGASMAGALVLSFAAGSVLAAGGLAAPFTGAFAYRAGASLAGAAGVALGILLLVAPYSRERPGALLARARPFLAAGGALLAAASAFLIAANVAFPAPVPYLPGPAIPLLAIGVLSGAIGASILGFPIVLNQVPREGAYAPLGATALGLAAGALAFSPLFPIARLVGGALLVLGAGLVIALLSPLRAPRRACPPGEA